MTLFEKTDTLCNDPLLVLYVQLIEAIRTKDIAAQQRIENEAKPLIGELHGTDHEATIDWIFLRVKVQILVDIENGVV